MAQRKNKKTGNIAYKFKTYAKNFVLNIFSSKTHSKQKYKEHKLIVEKDKTIDIQDLTIEKQLKSIVQDRGPIEAETREPHKSRVYSEFSSRRKLGNNIRPIIYLILIISYALTAVFYYGVYLLFIEPTLIIPSIEATTETASQIPSNIGTLEYYARYIYHFPRSNIGSIILFPLFLFVIFLSELSYLLLALVHRIISKKRKIPIGLWKNQPLVSIIIPAHNEEKVIGHTIETVLETSYPNKEIIVINDGSTDGTERIVRRYDKKGLVRLINRRQGGKGVALNQGVLLSKGEIVVTIDADGAIERRSLEKLLSHFQIPVIAAVSGNVKVGNRVNMLTWLQSLEYIREISLRRRALDLLNTVYVIPGALGAFRREAYSQIGSYDSDTVAEDMDITVKLLKTKGQIPYEDEAIVHTEAPESFSSWNKQRLRWYGGTLQTLVKHIKAGGWWKHGTLSFIGLPYLILSMFVVPILELVLLIFAITHVILGLYSTIIILFLISFIIDFVATAIAVIMEKEDKIFFLYSFIYTVFYKYLIDITRMRSYWQASRGKMSWSKTRSERYGDLSKTHM